jgi:hypothetical protein
MELNPMLCNQYGPVTNGQCSTESQYSNHCLKESNSFSSMILDETSKAKC